MLSENPLHQFYISTTIACIGFLLLLAQLLLSTWKTQAICDSPETSSAAISDEEAQKPTTPDSQSPWGLADAEPGPEPGSESDEAGVKRVHDRIDALLSQFHASGCTDTTREMVDAVCSYLRAAEYLLRLPRHRSGGVAGPVARDELNCDAGLIVQCATDETASLGELGPGNIDLGGGLLCFLALLAGSVSVLAVWVAAVSYTLATRPPGVDDESASVIVIRFSLCGGSGQSAFAGAKSLPVHLYLVTICIQVAVQALTLGFMGLCTKSGVFKLVFIYPAYIAFSCMVTALWLHGLETNVLAVCVISSLVFIVMTVLAAMSSALYELERECASSISRS